MSEEKKAEVEDQDPKYVPPAISHEEELNALTASCGKTVADLPGTAACDPALTGTLSAS